MFGGWEGRRLHACKSYVRCLLGKGRLYACSFKRVVHMKSMPVELQSFATVSVVCGHSSKAIRYRRC